MLSRQLQIYPIITLSGEKIKRGRKAPSNGAVHRMVQTEGGTIMHREMNFWVIGGDRRQAALAQGLAEDGHTVHTFALERAEGMHCEDSLEELARADCVVLPLPVLNGVGKLNAPLCGREHTVDEVLEHLEPGQLLCAGKVNGELRAAAEARGLLLHDYFAREELAVANAVPTAEGAVQTAMEVLPITLHGARVLVLGYGRIGRVTSQRMAALGAQVTVAARSREQLAWAKVWGYHTEHIGQLVPWLCGYDLVINTVPAVVLGREELSALRPGTPVIELASKPGGVELDAAAELGVKVIAAACLPGKVAPETAAGYIRDTIYHIIEELET